MDQVQTLKSPEPAEPSRCKTPAAHMAPATPVGEIPCPPCRLTGDGSIQGETSSKG